jgi:acylphosphatase
MTSAVDVVVHGLVQGVFFRDACRREAARAGVTGWVRNQRDGTVAAHFEGAPDAVRRMVDWARVGPPHAEVERVDVTPSEPQGLARFEVR